ncbi:beta-ketoacyl synthase N-terminal-like domain-containing protein [Geopsychrobacter electrodiphilus]|uniref:beta-ketoacyl synthase N-terminal-like domain-containing protein n=1 Tax=Geopsychrobacter electrodiphilus TaxID=225196 RepID=UPI001FE12E33|nr:beta-ketoacyl synthase N-terminal-like domain-containing protein [Geopsychrobacter electrodiphilus]
MVLTRAVPVTALGENLAGLWQGLLREESGIAPLTHFDCGNYLSGLGGAIAGLQAPPGGSRLDPLLERVAVQLGPLPVGCRLLVASTKGEIDRLETVGRQRTLFPRGVLFEPLLAKIARRFDLADPGSNINAACASSSIALARGAAQIAAGQAEAVLIYSADILSEFVFSGFSALQALSPEPSRPFDRQRQGLTLGEAGVALLLMSEACARTAGETVLAYVAGWGVANDAHHVTAPARDGSGLIRASRLALCKAALAAEQIAAINAHGTGTVYNDAMELTAFGEIFGDSLPPMHGVKGSLGHCLGAAGGVEIAIAARALQEQTIPATCGCLDPEEATRGRVMNSSQSISGDYLLCTNSGFGGINSAVILQRGAQ